jgi:acetolactate synthase I/II/III large subunit
MICLGQYRPGRSRAGNRVRVTDRVRRAGRLFGHVRDVRVRKGNSGMTGTTGMNGAESLVRTLVACGVDTCFANPGTSEMHFGATREHAALAPFAPPELPTGKLDAVTVAQVIGHLLPEQAIISNESATSGFGLAEAMAQAAPHDQLALTGGSIGQGIPVGTGAAVACPDRKVVCLQGDGGAMYTLQALWTQARENLDVTTVIFANHSYAILNIELSRVGIEQPGPKALSTLDLHNPTLDWQHLAAGLGVEASRAHTVEEFADQFGRAMRNRGPRLIEVVL